MAVSYKDWLAAQPPDSFPDGAEARAVFESLSRASLKRQADAVLDGIARDEEREWIRQRRAKRIRSIQSWILLACAGVCAVWCVRHWTP